MKLRNLFAILAVLLLVTGVGLLLLALERGGGLVWGIEVLILCMVVILFYLYRKAVKPLDSIASGMDLLREQDFSSRLKQVGQPESDRIVMIFNRMMDQLKEERLRLREQNHFLDLLIESSPMGVIILDFDEHFTMLNKAALKFLEVADVKSVKGMRMEDLASPLSDEITRMPKGTTRTIRLGDAKIYRCSRLSFVDRGFAHPFVLVESLTSEVVKAEKKAYEKIIRMIAHEVNNTVGGVTSALDTVQDMLPDVEQSADLREVMSVCIERSLKMSRFITNFADVVKIPEPQLKEVALNDVILSCRAFLESLCTDRKIELRCELCAESPRVKLDQVLFEQVLVNIVKNAVESISSEGVICVRTSPTAPMLEIADNGIMISREVEDKLFTPFFSTKLNGQGIGLLFIREVLDRHGCTFSLRTHSDGWTKFRISWGEQLKQNAR